MSNDSSSPSSRSSRRSAGLHSLANVVIIFLILLGINYWGFRHYIHKDLSSSQFYTLSPKTTDILHNLPAPVTVYTYLSEQSAQGQQITTLLKEYQRSADKNFNMESIDPDSAPERAKSLQHQLHFDGNDEVVIIQYTDPVTHNANNQFVKVAELYDTNPFTGQSTFKGEQLLTSAIQTALEGKTAKVYFTVGHGEHSIRVDQRSAASNGYALNVEALKYENISSLELNLAQKGEVPVDADAVIIAGPSIAFSPIEIEALERYLKSNGKLMVLLDPYCDAGLAALLQPYAIKYEDDLVLSQFQSGTGVVTYPMAVIYQNGFGQHPINQRFAQSGYQLVIPTARSITIASADKKTVPLLQTDENAWGWITKNGPLPDNVRDMSFNKITDIPGPLNIAALFDGGQITDPATKATVTATRVVAIGGSKFLEDQSAQPVSRNFFTNCVAWMIKKNPVLDISPKKPQDYGVSVSPMQFRTIIWCALVFVPGTALALGVFTWLSRRK